MDLNNPANAVKQWWTRGNKNQLVELLRMLGVSRAVFVGWRRQGYIPQKYMVQLEEMGFVLEPDTNRDFTFIGHPEDVMALRDIGGELGVSKERVRRITLNAMRKFAKQLEKRNIKKEDFF